MFGRGCVDILSSPLFFPSNLRRSLFYYSYVDPFFVSPTSSKLPPLLFFFLRKKIPQNFRVWNHSSALILLPEWSSWAPCPAPTSPCRGKNPIYTRRNRTILSRPMGKGRDCPLVLEQRKACPIQLCFTVVKGEWSPCQVGLYVTLGQTWCLHL